MWSTNSPVRTMPTTTVRDNFLRLYGKLYPKTCIESRAKLILNQRKSAKLVFACCLQMTFYAYIIQHFLPELTCWYDLKSFCPTFSPSIIHMYVASERNEKTFRLPFTGTHTARISKDRCGVTTCHMRCHGRRARGARALQCIFSFC